MITLDMQPSIAAERVAALGGAVAALKEVLKQDTSANKRLRFFMEEEIRILSDLQQELTLMYNEVIK